MPPSVLNRVIEPDPAHAEGGGAWSGREAMVDLLTVAVESAPVAMALFDRQMRYLLANPQWVREFRLEGAGSLEGRSQYEVFPKLHPGWRQVYERALQGYVVRSEHDVLASSSGQPVLCRWEVRPWRKKADASVGGVMVVCERFLPTDEGVLSKADAPPRHEERLEGAAISAAAAGKMALAGVDVPVFELDDEGRVLQANARAMNLALCRGLREGVTRVWEVLASEAGRAAQRQQLLEAMAAYPAAGPRVLNLAGDELARLNGAAEGLPARWLLAAEEGEGRWMLLGLSGLSPFEPVSKVAIRLKPEVPVKGVADAPALAAAREETERLRRELNVAQETVAQLRRELRTRQEVEQTLVQRDKARVDAMDRLPVGLLIVNGAGAPVFQNAHLRQLAGGEVQRGERVEDWLARCATSPEAAEELRVIWREDVWRRQLTRRVTVAGRDGLMREVELQPASLADGGLLVQVLDVTEWSRLDEQLSSLEGKFRAAVMGNPLPVILTDRMAGIFEVNPAASSWLGLSRAELRRMPLDDLLTEDSRALRREAAHRLKTAGGPQRVELEMAQAGSRRVTLVPIQQGGRAAQGVLYFFQEAEQLATQQPAPTQLAPVEPSAAPPVLAATAAAPADEPPPPQRLLRRLVEMAPNGRVREWTPDAEQVFGYAAADVGSQPLYLLFQPTDAAAFYQRVREAVDGPAQVWKFHDAHGGLSEVELQLRHAEGGGVEVLESRPAEEPTPVLAPSPAAAAPEQPEPPAQKGLPLVPRPEWAMGDLNRERLLLTEIHHRVRNQLQILGSVLNCQANRVEDATARGALISSQNRLRCIAALHRHLEMALGSSAVNWEQFVGGMAEDLRGSLGVSADQVAVELDLPGARLLPPEWLMPVTLMIHEALTNSFQHAFPQGRKGRVRITLQSGEGQSVLRVEDDGVGFDAESQLARPAGLGLKLMGVFADQMRADLRIGSDPAAGSFIEMKFSIAFI
ncbi:MAG: PAS domain-containing protein [Verrucomicrobiales bacterium]|nr:PAS domain-containing protein [Verrucomicrobiales bacterium]